MSRSPSAAVSLKDQLLPHNETLETTKSVHSPVKNMYIRERKERKGSSYVWKYCDKISRHLVRCNLCNKMMSFHGTANVITHLQRRHNIVGKIDGDRVTLVDTIPDLPLNEEQLSRRIEEEEESHIRPYRRSSSTASVVWKYCTRVGRDVVRCGFCKKNLSYQGTSNLQRHLHRMHGVVTQVRCSKDEDHDETETWKCSNSTIIWKHCSTVEGCDDKTKCNLCNNIFNSNDVEEIGKHLRITHGIELRETKHIQRRKRRDTVSESDSSSDEDFEDDKDWSKNSNDAILLNDTSIKKDELYFDEIIEEDPDHANGEEEPFDPCMISEIPSANPLSSHSSRAASPLYDPRYIFKSKKLQKLTEEKVRMETEYFREKAGFYRMQKYLTALQANKMRKELEQMNNGNVLKSDNFTDTNLTIIGNTTES